MSQRSVELICESRRAWVGLPFHQPRREKLNLRFIFDRIGIDHAEDYEKGSGKTIWHFLFEAAKYCVAVEVMLRRYLRTLGKHKTSLARRSCQGYEPASECRPGAELDRFVN